jgi:ubiquinone/menaquinone biosynthesis C-methylase UbiE
MTEHIRPQTVSPREIYSQRDNPSYKGELAKRTAARHAAFLLPHLRPGMRLLAVGSGPGTITLGLAKTVAPGEVVGIDIEPTQVEEACAAAAERGVTNARFEVGDAYRLPFADRSFDAVFAHTVLMHLREPVRALADMRRVLRPGGIIGVRDPDVGAGFSVPATPLQEQRRALQLRVLQQHGGDFSLGRHHRRLLLEAGFVRAEATASAESAGSPESTRRRAAIAKIRLQGFAKIGLTEGWVTEATVDAMLADIDLWAESPDAFYVSTWCEAVGWRGD